jgi:predicted ATP-binding protein involved in virulence
MFLEALRVTDFRCFEDREFAFPGRTTGVVGVNGSGKTALLEACSVILGAVISLAGSRRNPRPIGFDDERGGIEGSRPPVDISAVFHIEDARCLVAVSNRNEVVGVDSAMAAFLDVIRRPDALHPVLAHYRTGRLWYGEPGGQDDDLSWTAGYAGSLDPAVQERSWMRWLTSGSEAQRKLRRAQLTSVFHHLNQLFGPGSIEVNIQNELQFVAAGRREPIKRAADGIRSIFTIMLDLIWRMSVLNPQFAVEEAVCAPGIVLIDEIDLHLHPSWQRRAIAALRATFPDVHFIVTTHSPFVLKELPRSAILNLDGRSAANDGSIEDISEEVLGVPLPQRSLRQQAMVGAAREYLGALAQRNTSDEQLAVLKHNLDVALIPFADDVGVLAFLDMEETVARSRRG